MAIANPIATGGQAVRNASTALATMTGLSPFQSPLIQRAMTFAGARRESTFPPSAHAASSIKLAAVGAWRLVPQRRSRQITTARTLAEGSVRRAGPHGYPFKHAVAPMAALLRQGGYQISVHPQPNGCIRGGRQGRKHGHRRTLFTRHKATSHARLTWPAS